MSTFSITPTSSASKHTASNHTLSTPTQRSSDNVHNIRSTLRSNHLTINDRMAAKRFAGVVEEAMTIINGDRNSAMRTQSQEKAVATHDRLETRNQTTFMSEMWKHMIRDERDLRTGTKDEWITQTWQHDHLDHNLDAEFVRQSIPALDVGQNPDMVKLYAAFVRATPKIKNPKPDMAFGLQPSAFTKEENAVNDMHSQFTAISPGLFHTFFVVEGKGSGGSLAEAENQACGAGAAVVNAMKQLISLTNDGVIAEGVVADDVDKRSMAFSLSMVPSLARMSVHWVEVTQQGTWFHMQSIAHYLLNQEVQIKKLRHDIDNVLDWGVLQRKTQVCTVVKALQQKTLMARMDSPAKKRRRD